ncbi:MAG: phosphoribosyl-AMP cyclohydrolase [Pseudomonadota bacterium]
MTAHHADTSAHFTPTFAPSADPDQPPLITAVAVDADDGTVLMLAHMDARALAATRRTGIAHFWSRSQRKIWRKGETSGNELAISRILVDCDQDALVLEVRVLGNGVACHTGVRSCFYRSVPLQAGDDGDVLTWLDQDQAAARAQD